MKTPWFLALALAACDGGGGGGDHDVVPERCADCQGRALPPLVIADDPPPPLSGGTLAVDAAGAIAVAADPDRDRVSVVDLAARRVRFTVEAGGEPGRVVVGDGHAFVALRRGGAVLDLDLETGETARLPACPAPRGLALEGDRLHVACAGGELWTLAGGEVVRRRALDPDLRDVVVAGDRLYVSRFRAAELLVLDGEGRVTARLRPPADHHIRFGGEPVAPTVAWRTVATPDGTVLMLHQHAQLSPVVVDTPGGYGASPGGCGRSIVEPVLTAFAPDGAARHVGTLAGPVLAVDLAPHPTGTGIAIAAPGMLNGATVVEIDAPPTDGAHAPCFFPAVDERPAAPHVTAVARDGAGRLYAFSREPAALLDARRNVIVRLGETSRFDAGHDLFHRDAGGGIACASCHPEGREDGHTWNFRDMGLRRSQSLLGGLRGTEPFHWIGDMADFTHLAREVMGARMAGPVLSEAYAETLLDWIDAQPALPSRAVDAAAAARGRDVFVGAGCAGCHAGDALTDNGGWDVGTGGVFQTPSLRGVGARAPLLHDGCAPTLADRFSADCGGGDAHGRTSHLSADRVADLVTYLETL